MESGFHIRWNDELAPRGPSDVEVFRRLHPDGSTELVVWRSTGGYDIDIEGIAHARVSIGAPDVQVRCLGPAQRQAAEDCLAHYILPHLSQLEGRPAIHASAVGIGDRVVGFIGRSGMGKSTLATSFPNASLVTDDSLVLEEADERFLAAPTLPRTRLYGDSLDAVARTPALREIGEKGEIELEGPRGKLPLARLYLLDRSDEAIAIVRMSQRDGMLALASHLHRIDPTNPELLAREVAFLEAVVRRVPVARLTFPRRYERLSAVHRAILTDLEKP